MCSRSELNKILRQMAETYRAIYGEDIVKTVLYGSYARGDNQEDSDTDTVGIVRGDRTDLQEQLKKFGMSQLTWS